MLQRELHLAKLPRGGNCFICRRNVLTGLENLDPGRLDEKVTVPDVPVDWTLRAWLWYLVEHEVHHKAQLALYLREIGVVPPFFALAFPPGIRPDIRV